MAGRRAAFACIKSNLPPFCMGRGGPVLAVYTSFYVFMFLLIFLSGWSANSKYAVLGSLRSTSAMISYELILSSAIFVVIILSGSLNFTATIENQEAI